jgi:mannose-6-phosphate isomerase-like protein (cupin superfamily)
MKTRYAEVPPFVTRDGSEIRELMHPARHGGQQQSLAEAIIRPGERTQLHCHHRSEEIYHVTAGSGLMTLGNETFAIGIGDTVRIDPGTPHCVEAGGTVPLRILCACAPPYSHEDTRLLEGGEPLIAAQDSPAGQT